MNAKRSTKFTFTKIKAIQVYAKHEAPKWVKFAFKYFSKSTETQNLKPGKAIAGILLSLFAVGFIATVLKLPRAIIAPVTYAYMGILTILVGFLLAAVWTNNRRIRKITKELGCSLEEWNRFVDLWGDELK
jgi:Flp pilus assembly protein TadB